MWVLGPQHRTCTRVMDGFFMPAVLIEAMPHGPRRGNLEPTSPWDQCSLPGEHPGCIQEGEQGGVRLGVPACMGRGGVTGAPMAEGAL